MSEASKSDNYLTAPTKSYFCSTCYTAAMSICKRCLSVVYCGKECQNKAWFERGTDGHKEICNQIKKLKAKVEEEGEKLKKIRSGTKSKGKHKPKHDENLFETSVGNFSNIQAYQYYGYCEALKELALTLNRCGRWNKSKLALEMARDKLLNLLKLTGWKGNYINDIKMSLPSILIYLGDEQKSCDFFKRSIIDDCVVDRIMTTDINCKNAVIFDELVWADLSTSELVDICLIKLKNRAKIETTDENSKDKIELLNGQIKEISSYIKESNELVWKYLVDPTEMSCKVLRELSSGGFLLVADPVTNYMKEFLEVKNNVDLLWDEENVKDAVKKYIGKREDLLEACANSDWEEHFYKGGRFCNPDLTKYHFFVDCYRLRLRDDLFCGSDWYPDYPAIGAKDFMVFCCLAVRKKMIPIIWDWQLLIGEASKLLHYDLEDLAADADWGSFGLTTLRETASKVYRGYGENGGINGDELMADIENDDVEKQNDIFLDIGGRENWRRGLGICIEPKKKE